MDFHRIKQIVQREHTLTEHEWKGAVLFLCNEDYVFFIRRSESMPTHGGQIAFIGGHKKTTEANPWVVIEREFEEETGFHRKNIEFLGYLPVVMTSSLRPIVPVLGKLHLETKDFLKNVTSNGEWDECLAYPWSELRIEKNWEFAWRNGYSKVPVLFHALRRASFIPKHHQEQAHLLWGATASMVWDFLRLYYGPSAGSY
jgi:8-oxo-dGTP pyrophosphatase MutT (NUDIX family)